MQQGADRQGSRGTGAFHVENTPATHSASVDRVNEAQAKLAFACRAVCSLSTPICSGWGAGKTEPGDVASRCDKRSDTCRNYIPQLLDRARRHEKPGTAQIGPYPRNKRPDQTSPDPAACHQNALYNHKYASTAIEQIKANAPKSVIDANEVKKTAAGICHRTLPRLPLQRRKSMPTTAPIDPKTAVSKTKADS